MNTLPKECPMTVTSYLTIHDLTEELREALSVVATVNDGLSSRMNLNTIEQALVIAVGNVATIPFGFRAPAPDSDTSLLAAYLEHCAWSLVSSVPFQLITRDMATLDNLTITNRYRLCLSWSTQ